MNLLLRTLNSEDKTQFKEDMQEAFQYGFEVEYGKSEQMILLDEDIEQSLNTRGAIAYTAILNRVIVGGAVVVIDEETKENHLDFLYVKVGCQSKGVGQAIWNAIEEKHPDTIVWKTCTPYFEKRNIHFYVNRCGFHIVEFFNPWHKNPRIQEKSVGGMPDEAGDYFFEFEKVMK